MSYTYKDAGVDIGKGERFADLIKNLVIRPQWIQREETGYAAILKFTDPPIAVTVDGIGTKLTLHRKFGTWHEAAEDLVAMNYNDLLCVGAKPMVFLDYLGVESLGKEHEEFIKALVEILNGLDVALVAGETAEMPGVYSNEWDAVGFCLGPVVRRIPVETVKEGDLVVGIEASGFHSNGWSLIRKILEEERIDPSSLEFQLLTGTRIYREVLDILEFVKSLAHVTGGGIKRALRRLLRGKGARIILKSRDYTDWILRYVDFEEAVSTFNMGYGMLMVVDEQELEHVKNRIHCEVIGEVVGTAGFEIIYDR